MLLIVQFPLTDLRPFLDLETGRLNRPYWNISAPDEDFIRSFGHMRVRRRGGLTGWVGESIVCEANRAIRLENLTPFRDEKSGKFYQPKIVFKRFYSDGSSLGKFEVGIKFQLSRIENVSENLIKDLLMYALRIPVVIPLGLEKIKCDLVESGKHLANLYLLSTTEVSLITQAKNSWVKSGKPMIMVLRSEKEMGKIHFLGKQINTNPQDNMDLWYYLLPCNGKNYPVCFFEEGYSDSTARLLRIYIARLYAEKECLKRVLENIVTGVIKIQPKTRLSDELQNYLNFATKVITNLESKTDSLSANIINDSAVNVVELIAPGERDEILKALKRIDVRLNIFRKVEQFVNQIIIKENIMGDKYTVGQAGAVGPNAHAHDMNFHQIWNNSKEKIDLSKLANELSLLREKMKEESAKPEHDISVGAVASAEVAAKDGDGPKVFESLAKAGQWALDVAVKIGVGLATQALKTALGI